MFETQSSQQARTSIRVGGARGVLTVEKMEAELEAIVCFGPFLETEEVKDGEQTAMKGAIGGKDGCTSLKDAGYLVSSHIHACPIYTNQT